MESKVENIFPNFDQLVSTKSKELFLNQKGITLWFTGLSGSGKSTIALALEKELFNQGYLTKVLDGDNIRNGLSGNLGFSLEDRKENIRRIAEVSKLFNQTGLICLNTFISPTIAIRAIAKEIITDNNFVEIFVNTPLDICEKRDTKGLYKKARAGEIKNFTGINAPFENPTQADIELNTTTVSIKESVAICIEYINQKFSETV